MKKIYLVRHAKSSWDNSRLPDFERPLNQRGKKDAPFMGELFARKRIKPQIMISSPAVRALATAKIFAEKLNYPADRIVTAPTIYEGSAGDIMLIISSLSDYYSELILFGHNPALTVLNNYLTDKPVINIPTCGISGIKFDVKKWKDIKPGGGRNFMFEYPKKYLDG